MPLTETDQQVLQRCLERKSAAWQRFVDRFLGLVIHVVNHSAQAYGIRLTAADRDDLCAEVMLSLIKNDFTILRHFRRQSSLGTYLTVVARRIVVRLLLKRRSRAAIEHALPKGAERILVRSCSQERPDLRTELKEEADWLLARLQESEARILKMYHLEEKRYEEIGKCLGIPANSVGPALSRARHKIRCVAEHRRPRWLPTRDEHLDQAEEQAHVEPLI